MPQRTAIALALASAPATRKTLRSRVVAVGMFVADGKLAEGGKVEAAGEFLVVRERRA